MPTALELKQKIGKLEKGLTNKALSNTAKAKLKTQIQSLKKDLEKLKKAKTPQDRIAEAKALALKIRRTQQGVPTGKSDIEKDATRKAMKTVKRVSQGLRANQYGSKAESKGHVYYEKRDNRFDRKPERYARLEDGGMMADGGVSYGTFGSGRLSKNAWVSANYIGDSKVTLGDLQSYLERNTKEEFDKDKIYTITRTLYKTGEYVIDDNKNWKESKIYRKRKMAEGGVLDAVFESGGGATSSIGGTSFSDADLSAMFENGGELHRSEGGNMYAKGGIVEHGLKVGDKILSAGTTLI